MFYPEIALQDEYGLFSCKNEQLKRSTNFVSIQLTIQQSSTVTFRQGFSKICCRRIMMALGISTYVHLQVTMFFFSIWKSWFCEYLSVSQPCNSKWEESRSKCSGHCCSIDYQWKRSDSLSQVSLFTLPQTLRHTEAHN